MRTIQLIFAFDGTDFCGWQVQPGQNSIQAEMMRAIEKITGDAPVVEPSGRTDAGVHALAQSASFRTASTIPCKNLVPALNRHLPHSIRVMSAEDREEGFHARFNARAKTYRYRIYRGAVCPPERWRYVHHFPYPLDELAMEQAAGYFEGPHDFTSFTTLAELPSGGATRIIHSSKIALDDHELVYTVRGSGFLHHMVRNLVGTLLEVGKGNFAPVDVARIIAARNRTVAGPTAPSKGLWLVGVEY